MTTNSQQDRDPWWVQPVATLIGLAIAAVPAYLLVTSFVPAVKGLATVAGAVSRVAVDGWQEGWGKRPAAPPADHAPPNY